MATLATGQNIQILVYKIIFQSVRSSGLLILQSILPSLCEEQEPGKVLAPGAGAGAGARQGAGTRSRSRSQSRTRSSGKDQFILGAKVPAPDHAAWTKPPGTDAGEVHICLPDLFAEEVQVHLLPPGWHAALSSGG